MEKKKDWEQRLKEKWYLWNYNKELGNYTTCENEVIDFIQAELDRAREEGKLYALDNLKDYIFINDTHRNKDLPLTWDDLRHYIKEVEQIYSENLSKLTTK